VSGQAPFQDRASGHPDLNPTLACRLAPLFDGISIDGERAVGLNDNIRLYR
jgi:hypothetical protein